MGHALLSAADYAGVTLLGRFSDRENAGGAFESTVTGFAVDTVCLPPMALLEGLLPASSGGRRRRQSQLYVITPPGRGRRPGTGWDLSTARSQVPWRDLHVEFPGGVGNTRKDPEAFAGLVRDVETKIFDVLPDETWVYPGHGNDTTLGAERPHLPEWRARGW